MTQPVCLVTGGSGFVGGKLIERLIASGWHIRALARSEEASRIVLKHGAQPVRGALDDEASLLIAAEGCESTRIM